MATKITVNGQVTIPKRLRDALGLCAGDRLEFAVSGAGELRARKAPRSAAPLRRASPAAPPLTDAQRHAADLVAVLRALD